jgi:hypothetical protein
VLAQPFDSLCLEPERRTHVFKDRAPGGGTRSAIGLDTKRFDTILHAAARKGVGGMVGGMVGGTAAATAAAEQRGGRKNESERGGSRSRGSTQECQHVQRMSHGRHGHVRAPKPPRLNG